jgi:protein-disulfide isomerase
MKRGVDVSYPSEEEIDRQLAATRPRAPAGFADDVLRRVPAAVPVDAVRVRRRWPWIAVAAVVAAATPLLALLVPTPADDRWRAGGGALAPGATLVAAEGEHIRLERHGHGALVLDGAAAATLVDGEVQLQRGQARLEGRAAVTTPWARVVGTEADTMAVVQTTPKEEDMLKQTLVLGAAAASAVTIVVVRGATTVNRSDAASVPPLVLRAGDRATLPAPPRSVASAAEAVSSALPPAPASAGARPTGEPGANCDEESCANCDEVKVAPSDVRVNVSTDGGPTFGPPGARVVIVEFSDYQCKFCERALGTANALAAMYPNDVRIVYRNFPLPGHSEARAAAEAALAAGAQGKYWEMHDLLLANQEHLDRAALESYATELGLDLGRFRSDLDSHRFAAEVERDVKEGMAVGIEGVPTFVINGRLFAGARPIDELKKIVDEELGRR